MRGGSTATIARTYTNCDKCVCVTCISRSTPTVTHVVSRSLAARLQAEKQGWREELVESVVKQEMQEEAVRIIQGRRGTTAFESSFRMVPASSPPYRIYKLAPFPIYFRTDPLTVPTYLFIDCFAYLPICFEFQKNDIQLAFL